MNQGLDAGLTVSDAKEILVQLYAYAGFPRSLNALGELMKVLEARKQRGIQDAPGREPSRAIPTGEALLAVGTANQTKLSGAPVKGPLFDFAPAIDEYLKTHLFGDIFARDNLDWQSRELATVGALAALPGVESQLHSHMRISMNVGLTPSQQPVGDTTPCECSADLARHGPRPRRASTRRMPTPTRSLRARDPRGVPHRWARGRRSASRCPFGLTVGARAIRAEARLHGHDVFPVPEGKLRRCRVLPRVWDAARDGLPELRHGKPAGRQGLQEVRSAAQRTPGRAGNAGSAIRPPESYTPKHLPEKILTPRARSRASASKSRCSSSI